MDFIQIQNSRYSLVSIATGYWMYGTAAIPGMGRFFYIPQCGSGAQTILQSNGDNGPFLGGKVAGVWKWSSI
jgi:hypothetical protein